MTEVERVFSAVLEAAAGGRVAVLATIVRAKGSTPRGVGSRMLVDLDGGLTGTIGGGCGEARVIEAAQEVAASGTPRRVWVDLTEDLFSWSPAICGGAFEVFLERVEPTRGPEASPLRNSTDS